MAERIEALVKPELLIWARETAGLGVDDAARKAGVKAPKLTQWEGGEGRPTVAQLRKLADLYKRPLGVFFLDQSPAEISFPPDFRRADPVRRDTLSQELRLAIRKARLKRQAALEFFQEVGESPVALAETADLSDDPEGLGLRIRNLLDVGDKPLPGDAREQFNFWRGSLERIGILVFQAEKIDVEEMRGLSLAERPLPVVVLNIKDAFQARNFSLFHETAHVLLGSGGLCDFDDEESTPEKRRIEVFCNHVAGATLAPAAMLSRRPETPKNPVGQVSEAALVSLAKTFGASPETIYRRLVMLGKVPLPAYLNWRDDYRRRSARRPKKPEGFAPPPTMALASNGRLFTQLVLDAYADERIGASDVLEYLGVRPKHLDKIREALRQPIAEEVAGQ
jgi:Zn-dependent peptidase ImmA (M78 family)/transcriptional regulator with XRE-family HTH domain